jgi:hypothetical protein
MRASKILGGAGCLAIGLSAFACGSEAPTRPSESTESTSEAVMSSQPLYYEGSCSFLACNSVWSTPCQQGSANCYYCPTPAGGRSAGSYQAQLACNMPCTNSIYLVAPTKSCGTQQVVCYAGNYITATVQDSSNIGVWEGSQGLFDALIGHYGTYNVALHPVGDPGIQTDPQCVRQSSSGGGGGGGGPFQPDDDDDDDDTKPVEGRKTIPLHPLVQDVARPNVSTMAGQ